jgi:hypothetical protein
MEDSTSTYGCSFNAVLDATLSLETTERLASTTGEYSFGTAALDSMKSLATDVRGGIVPFSGHWIAEERPDFLTDQLFKFFGNSTTIGS